MYSQILRKLSNILSSYLTLLLTTSFVLLDIRMPRLNGLQLFYRLKAISPNTKIMFCSALDIAEELTSILPDITYNHIIRKPLKREYFVTKINSMLGTNNVHFQSSGV